MNEDIKLLKEKLKRKKQTLEIYRKTNCIPYVYLKIKLEAEALEHILNEYERMKKIIEREKR